MKLIRPVWAVLAVCVTVSAAAQESIVSKGLDIAVERARLRAEQAAVQAIFESESVACYGRFAVSDCLRQQRALRREKLDDLRRQEVALNQMERAQRAQEQLGRIRDKMQSD